MANDERRGDDLFEDLDKFFAPIKDVDWDEREASSPSTPQEEHVAVRSEPAVTPTPPTPAARPPDPTGAAGPSEAAPPVPAPSPSARDAEPPPGSRPHEPEVPTTVPEAVAGSGEDEADEEAWYDTGVLDTVASFDLDDEADDVGAAPADAPDGDSVRIVEGTSKPLEDQADLFAGDDDDDAWSSDAVEHVPTAAETPSEQDLEAAAEHFAGSIRSEERYDTAPLEGGALVFEGDDASAEEPDADLLSDLGAGPADPAAVEEELLADLEREPQPTVVVGGGQGLGGPSWQEPAAIEVGADLERRGPDVGERDVPAAFMTGVVLAGVAVASLLVGETAFAIVAALGVLAAQAELFGVMTKHHLQPATFVGLVTGQLIIWGVFFRGEASIPAMLALGIVASFLWFMTVPAAHRSHVLQNLGVTSLNLLWIPLLAAYLLATLDLPDGRQLVIAVIGLTFIFDTAAFFVGSVWGGSFFTRPLAPSVSPKKSIEGLIGGALVVVVASVALVPTGFIDLLDGRRVEALLLGLVIAVAATLGDLAESLVKRDLGVKDMGSVLPGHGGVLDRIDSLLFVAPAAYLLFRVVFVP
jgi:phosphatidate cytidylyltransferase